jgi:mono/diheme cytochrome c family protein
MNRAARLLLAAFLLLAVGRAVAAPDHPIVPGFERFHAASPDALGGSMLLGELNCTSCHQPAEAAASRKQAPILDGVANRVRTAHLRKFLRDPQAVKPGTTMPGLFSGDAQRDDKVEALVHFLASTGAIRHIRPDTKSIANGRELYSKVGCVVCHGTRDAVGNQEKVLPTSVPLGDLKAKYTLGSLAAFLDNPHAVRPGGRMPKLLSGKEPADVANYLLQGIKAEVIAGRGATNYGYYEGQWDRVPDFDKLKPNASGTSPAFDLGVARRNSDFALRFEGFFRTDAEGTYTFHVNSDDGSRLWIDGKLVVDNDGVHAPKSVTSSAKLTKGVHKVVVGFFQVGGGVELDVHVDLPGQGQLNLGELVAPTEAALEQKPPVKKPDDEDAIEIQPALVEKGKVIFASAGCASCHQLSLSGKPIASTLNAPALGKLGPEGGCLSASPKGTPRYSLSVAQRQAIALTIKNPPAPPKSPEETIARTFTTFNCYACHQRNKVGGPEEELNKAFITTQPEMGDEGRVPPPLDGVGAKLTTEYLKQLLDKGAHDRPYMHTRMPGFGLANVGQLTDAFASLDTLPQIPPVTFADSTTKAKASARHLMGGLALGCIKCHTWGGEKAEGVQGIDMLLMPRRLKRDWFHAYINDPQRVRPGTRMPASFVKGMSVLPDVLDGTAATQIEAMWLYLQDGGKAQVPVGLHKQSIPLIPTDSAIIYRNFIEGAGTRAIGVGYPEKANLAFDANELRVAMIWQGAFIDARRHWTDRGAGSEGPLGDNVLRLPAGAPFAVLAKPDDPWPTTATKAQGGRFLGYRLTPDDRPTFLYSVADVKVEDFPEPVMHGKEVGLKRTLTLSAAKASDNLYYRAAAGNKIELADGWFRIDGTWKVRLQGCTPRIRQSAGKTELLVPVPVNEGKVKLVQEYVW